MRKRNTAFIFILSLLVAGVSTGCENQRSREDYSEIEVEKGDIADGLTREGRIAVKAAYENISLLGETFNTPEKDSDKVVLEIEEVYAVPGLAVNEGVPVIKLTDESVQAYKEMLEKEQKKAERAVSLAQMDKEEKSLDIEYTYQKSIADGQNAEEKYNLTMQTLENNIKSLQDEIAACQERIRSLESNNGTSTELTVERSNLSSLQTRLQTAQNEKESKEIQAKQEYDQAQLNYDYAEEVKENAEKELEDTVTSAQTYLTSINDAVEQFETNMGDGVIKASCSGTVVSVSCKAGEALKTDKNIITYADSGQITMTVGVSQNKILSFHVGDAVNLKLDVYENEVISGEIINLEPNASDDTEQNEYQVTVRMTDNEKTVYTDMTGSVVFTEKEVNDVLFVPVESIIRRNTASYVEAYDTDGSVKEIEVKTGFSDGENVEIMSGLEEGQKILVKNMEDESEETK
ncbi:macrolide transporter subunit MacA [Clostridiales bacterium CHKCI001]|nr:macrolide transporter subunit MacA [Clostridiales bacterium CHKCI001]